MYKITRFEDVKQFIGVVSAYHIDISLHRLEAFIKGLEDDYGVELNPDFQRGHVWNEAQQIKYMEFMLSGGLSGRDLYFNSPIFNGTLGEDIDTNKVLCVDGLQRITAARRFLNNEIRVFGSYYKEYEDKPRDATTRFKVYINGLTNKKDVLKWYIELNEGGTPHSEDEISRVKGMLGVLEENGKTALGGD